MRFILLLISTFWLMNVSAANSDEQRNAVLKPIHNLFDAMREGDAEKVLRAFAPDAIFYRAHETLRSGGTVEGFAQAVGSERDEIWDEKIWDVEVKIDDKLASVWTKFAFYRGEAFSHCGVNSFQLYHFEDGWRIVYLIDTNRKDIEDCELPPKP